MLATTATAGVANAEDTPYCEKVRALAAAESALLMGPVLRTEVWKIPVATGFPDAAGGPTGSEYQFRAGATISGTNIYKGFRVGKVADADCAQHEAMLTAQQLLLHVADYGRLAALRAQAAFLDQNRGSWERIATKMAERFAAQTVTLMNLEDVRSRTMTLERRRAALAGEIAKLELLGVETKRQNIAGVIAHLESTAMAYEREASHVRSISAWNFSVTGGYLPPIFSAQQNDAFGVVQLSYNLGGPWSNAAETRYVNARQAEIRTARYELPRKLEEFRSQVKVALASTQQELAVVAQRIASLRTTRATFASSDASGALYAVSMLDLELIGVESESAFLTSYVRELSQMEEK